MCFIGVLLIYAFSMSGCGGDGGGGPAAVAPTAPTAVTASAGDGQVTVQWTPVAEATTYNLYEGTVPGVTKTTGTKHANVTSPYTRTGCTNGITYYYVVTAVNAAGESDVSVEKTATPIATSPPIAPTNLRATAGNGKVTVSWDSVTGATSYNIYYGTTAGVTKATGTKLAGAVSPADVIGLTNGTTYYFVVTAVNANGESVESFVDSATPSAAPPPAAPTGVGAVAGNAKVTVFWTAVTGAYSYNIYYATSSGVTKATGTELRGQWGGGTQQDVTGLMNGTKYYFVVTAVYWNDATNFGETVESAEVSATPAASMP